VRSISGIANFYNGCRNSMRSGEPSTVM